MTVDFYTITEPPNKLTKNTPQESKISIQNVDIFKPSDIMSPRIILGTFTGMMSKNYCYIDKFARWYFISNITLTSAQRVMMDLSIDVLNTYASDIVKCKATAIRSQSEGMNYIPDDRYPISTVNTTIDMLKYDTPFTRLLGQNYILSVLGGGPSE